MKHSGDEGLILPPKLAPAHIVILPIIHKEEDRTTILDYCQKLAESLRQLKYHGESIRVEMDLREMAGGEKAWSWVKKGIPIRLEIGKKECAANTVFMGRRDKTYQDRITLNREEFIATVTKQLDEMQTNLLTRARKLQQDHTIEIKKEDDFYQFFKGHGGFALAHWNGNEAIETKLKQELSVTIRCLPFSHKDTGKCIFSGEKSAQLALFAKAY